MTDEELARGKYLNSELRHGVKVLDVVGNNSLGLTGDSHFSDHVVFWVSQQRSPEEKYPLLYSNETQVVDQRRNVSPSPWRGGMSQKYEFVFNYQGNRQSDSEGFVSKLFK